MLRLRVDFIGAALVCFLWVTGMIHLVGSVARSLVAITNSGFCYFSGRMIIGFTSVGNNMVVHMGAGSAVRR